MKNETAIITGGSRGIGKAIALKLAREGINIVITGRDKDTLRRAEDEIRKTGRECLYFSGDVRDKLHADKVVKASIEKFGTVDHLINNAGFGILKKFVDSTPEEFRDQMDVNVMGVYNFTKSVVPYMIKQGGGNIINIASLAGKNSFVGGTMYSATKHALLGFTKSLMLELREYNIRVASVCPGSVDTDFGNNTPGHRAKSNILTADDVAEAIYTIIKLPVNAMLSDLDIRPTNPGK